MRFEYTYFVSYTGKNCFGSSEIVRDKLIIAYTHIPDIMECLYQSNIADIDREEGIIINNFILLSKKFKWR